MQREDGKWGASPAWPAPKPKMGQRADNEEVSDIPAMDQTMAEERMAGNAAVQNLTPEDRKAQADSWLLRITRNVNEFNAFDPDRNLVLTLEYKPKFAGGK